MPERTPRPVDDAPAERSSRPTRHGAGADPAKRAKILDGAHRVFSQLGFDAAGMADITREAGVSKGTIYVYFPGKDELFQALMERERERMFRDIEAALNEGGTAGDKLRSFGRTLTRLLCSAQVIRAHRTIIGVTERKPELGAAFYENGARRGAALLRRVLAEGVAAGELRACDHDLAAYQFVELCLAGLFRQRLMAYMPDPPSEAQIEANVEAAVAVFLAAYGSLASPGPA